MTLFASGDSHCCCCTTIALQIAPVASTPFPDFMRRRLTYILIFLLSLSIIALWWPVNDSDCNFETFMAAKTAKFQVQATKVVVQPWRGRHHVYGIFMVPDEYKRSPFFVVRVKGANTYCSKGFGHKQNFDGIFAKPGTHLVRKFIRTRTAVRLILQGLYFQLNDTQNWTLTFPQSKTSQHNS